MTGSAGSINSPADLRALSAEILDQPTPVAARALVGQLIVRVDGAEVMVGRIVETEAYGGPEDRASHARAGLTRRTAPMFERPGTAYVYLVYGIHECLNVVAHTAGEAGAVLLRAIEPLAGIEAMQRRRGPAAGKVARLGAGPGRLCRALAVTRAWSGHDLLAGDGLWLAAGSEEPLDEGEVASGPRIGVAYAGSEWSGRPWRFWLRDHPSVSRP